MLPHASALIRWPFAGRNVDFLALLDEATDDDAKAKLLGSLVRADKNAVAAIGRDESCMQVFRGWLEELISQRSSFNVLELLLKVHIPAVIFCDFLVRQICLRPAYKDDR